MRTAELEVVQYNTEGIIDTSMKLIDTYSEKFSDDFVKKGDQVKLAVADIVLHNKSDSIKWRTPGLNIYFSGLPPVLPRVVEDRLVFSAREPHFILEESVEIDIEGARKKYVELVTEALIEEMVNEHGMKLEDDEILIYLNFSRDIFAEDVQIFEVPILE